MMTDVLFAAGKDVHSIQTALWAPFSQVWKLPQ